MAACADGETASPRERLAGPNHAEAVSRLVQQRLIHLQAPLLVTRAAVRAHAELWKGGQIERLLQRLSRFAEPVGEPHAEGFLSLAPRPVRIMSSA